MIKREPDKKLLLEFDEKGTNKVSEQIMDSYSSGFIDQEFAQTDNDEFGGAKG